MPRLPTCAPAPMSTRERIGALGLSMGGEVAMQAAAHTEQLKAVVSDGAGARSLGDRLSGPVNPLAVPAMWTLTYALALFTGLTPPPPLTELIPRIAPRPLLIISAGHGIGGEVELSDIFYAAAGEPKQHLADPGSRAHRRPGRPPGQVRGQGDRVL